MAEISSSESLTYSDGIHDVEVFGTGSESYPGKAVVRHRSSQEGFWYGLKKSGRIVLSISACLLPFAFLEPFLFMIWGGVVGIVLFVFVGPYLHLKFWGERVSLVFVESTCPSCLKPGKLEPFLNTAFEKRNTLLCAECGQTSTCYFRGV